MPVDAIAFMHGYGTIAALVLFALIMVMILPKD